MKIKKDRNHWTETERALRFCNGQLRKGWNIQEALAQIETSYGYWIHQQVIYELLTRLGKDYKRIINESWACN